MPIDEKNQNTYHGEIISALRVRSIKSDEIMKQKCNLLDGAMLMNQCKM